MNSAILVLTGASGAGKTTLLREIESKRLPGVACFNCDVVYASLPEDVRNDGWLAQDSILSHWINHARREEGIDVAVFDTQIRPHRAMALLAGHHVARSRVVLVECEQEERNRRLRGPRGQAELASAQMDSWAAYLRGQADALGLEIINTSDSPLNLSVERLAALVQGLRA